MPGQDEPDFSNAACGTTHFAPAPKRRGGPELLDPFYPERGTAQITARDAKKVCNGVNGGPECPIKAQCLEYALERKERFGIWGGMSERERASVARDRRVAARKRELEIELGRRRRSRAAKAAWENRRRSAVRSTTSLKELLAGGLITRGEYNQEIIHQEHKAALAAIRSRGTSATRTSKRGRRAA